jgi:hypothetical protein
MPSRNTIAVICSAFFAISACSTTTTQSFRIAESSNVEAAFIATDADFSKYHQLLAREMGIYFPQNVQMSDEDLARLRQIFRDAFLPKLDHYTIVSEPAPGTLAIQASLINLRKAGNADVLGRAADSTSTPAFAYGDGSATDWGAVEAAAEHWSILFRDFLDNYLGK